MLSIIYTNVKSDFHKFEKLNVAESLSDYVMVGELNAARAHCTGDDCA